MSKAKTLFEKIWDAHVVYEQEGYPAILYIDAHLIHEVTSPQAFDGLRKRKLPVFRTNRTWATMDHNVPTKDQDKPIQEPLSRKQVEMLKKNCEEFGVNLYGLGHPYQGIVHIIGPELGITKPGMTIVCGDSHTSTHGAFGAIAFGIGTSEVEEVLATQCILQYKPKTMNIHVDGQLGKGVVSKDIILYIISQISISGGTGYFVEYSGSAIRSLSMEARMTICNMSIEMGARGGMIAPDEVTYAYMKDRKFMPKNNVIPASCGAGSGFARKAGHGPLHGGIHGSPHKGDYSPIGSGMTEWEKAVAYWKTLPSDKGAKYDKELFFNAEDITPMITYGTNPGMGIKITEKVPTEDMLETESQKNAFRKSLAYMGLKQGQQMIGQKVDYVFFGSCTNSRIEDFRLIAGIVKGKRKADNITAFVVPGSAQVESQVRKEGLDKIFAAAGFELRNAGCSACLGMNEDKIPAGKYCVSTSNRNFEGRQGPGARTFLASPLTAAATAINGYISDVRELL